MSTYLEIAVISFFFCPVFQCYSCVKRVFLAGVVCSNLLQSYKSLELTSSQIPPENYSLTGGIAQRTNNSSVLACSGLHSDISYHFPFHFDSFFLLETKATLKIGTERGLGVLWGAEKTLWQKVKVLLLIFFQCLSLSCFPYFFLVV